MTRSFYGHIVEVEVDCSRVVRDKFPSRNEAVEFADAIPEPVSYQYLMDNDFQQMR